MNFVQFEKTLDRACKVGVLTAVSEPILITKDTAKELVRSVHSECTILKANGFSGRIFIVLLPMEHQLFSITVGVPSDFPEAVEVVP